MFFTFFRANLVPLFPRTMTFSLLRHETSTDLELAPPGHGVRMPGQQPLVTHEFLDRDAALRVHLQQVVQHRDAVT